MPGNSRAIPAEQLPQNYRPRPYAINPARETARQARRHHISRFCLAQLAVAEDIPDRTERRLGER
jgi:hypothetical protein